MDVLLIIICSPLAASRISVIENDRQHYVCEIIKTFANSEYEVGMQESYRPIDLCISVE